MRNGDELRAIRIALGLNQEGFACKIGCTRSHLGKMERGDQKKVSPAVLDLARQLRPANAWRPSDGWETVRNNLKRTGGERLWEEVERTQVLLRLMKQSVLLKDAYLDAFLALRLSPPNEVDRFSEEDFARLHQDLTPQYEEERGWCCPCNDCDTLSPFCTDCGEGPGRLHESDELESARRRTLKLERRAAIQEARATAAQRELAIAKGLLLAFPNSAPENEQARPGCGQT